MFQLKKKKKLVEQHGIYIEINKIVWVGRCKACKLQQTAI